MKPSMVGCKNPTIKNPFPGGWGEQGNTVSLVGVGGVVSERRRGAGQGKRRNAAVVSRGQSPTWLFQRLCGRIGIDLDARTRTLQTRRAHKTLFCVHALSQELHTHPPSVSSQQSFWHNTTWAGNKRARRVQSELSTSRRMIAGRLIITRSSRDGHNALSRARTATAVQRTAREPRPSRDPSQSQ